MTVSIILKGAQRNHHVIVDHGSTNRILRRNYHSWNQTIHSDQHHSVLSLSTKFRKSHFLKLIRNFWPTLYILPCTIMFHTKYIWMTFELLPLHKVIPLEVVVCTSRSEFLTQRSRLFTQFAAVSTFHTLRGDIYSQWEIVQKWLSPKWLPCKQT